MLLRVRTLPDGEDHRVELEDGATGFQLLENLNRNPEAHLLLRDRLPIPMDAPLDDRGEYAVVAIVSGGDKASRGAQRQDAWIAQPY
ncbi:MAG: hypothetical protein LN413_00925 [Candidatus Thermoplasmatota archaeon]|nr:hypothetical protein [Candidatus Thermoplasmatota archaeon]